MKKLILILFVVLGAPMLDAYQLTFRDQSVNQTEFRELLAAEGRDYNYTDYVGRIIVSNFGYHRGWCGLAVGGGRVIYINTACSHRLFKEIIRHEIRHAYWFRKLSSTFRYNYCKSLGLSYSRECWELFAEED